MYYKKSYSIIIIFAVFCFFLTACSSAKPQNSISNELGIDVSGGEEISNYDDHGGSHGDGATCIALQFSDDSVLKQISQNDSWQEFPLDETTTALVYGVTNETDGWVSVNGSYLTDGSGDPLVPEIQNGYYLLIDRQADSGNAAGADILHRSSFNFTLALYDTDTDTLYFCKLDT